MKRVVSATEARIHLGELMRHVVEHGQAVIVERAGEPQVVILSVREYERLQTAQRRTWQEALDQVVGVGERIQARRAGQPLTPPEEIVREAREGRDAGLTDLR